MVKPNTFPEKKYISAKMTGEKNIIYPSTNSDTCNSSLARNSSTYPLSSASCHSVAGTRAGLGLRFGVSPHRNKERRRSTGDEKQLPHQLNMFVRTRTDSGKQLSDMVIFSSLLLCFSHCLCVSLSSLFSFFSLSLLPPSPLLSKTC